MDDLEQYPELLLVLMELEIEWEFAEMEERLGKLLGIQLNDVDGR